MKSTSNQSIICILRMFLFIVLFFGFNNAMNAQNDIPENTVENKEIDDNEIYNQVEKKPEFPGGLQAFYEFIGKNYRVPKGLNGKVFVQFVVEKNGSIIDIKVLRDLGSGTGGEAIRVLRKSPKWIPGEVNGKPVRVLYSLPINVVRS